MATSSTSFSKKNQPKKRATRGKAKKSLMLDAIKSVCKNEKEFLKQVVAIGIGGVTKVGTDEDGKDITEYKAPNTILLNMVINRIEPPLKATSPMIQFKFNKKASPHEQAIQILEAVSKGLIAPDVGQVFINSIQAMLKIQEVTDIDERLKAMEKKVDETE